MSDFYFTKDIGENRRLCIASLTNRRLEHADRELSDPSGYYLYEQHGNGAQAAIKIIAQVISEAAAFDLRDLFGMA